MEEMKSRRYLRRHRTEVCSRHNLPLEHYCCTDDQFICPSCAIEHQGHNIRPVREECRRRQDEASKLKTKFQELLQEGSKAQALDQLHEKASETEDFCEAALAAAIESLQNHYMSLRELIRRKHRLAEKAIHNQWTEMKTHCSVLDSLLYTDSDVHFLQKWPTVRQRCEKGLLDLPDDLLLPFKNLQTAVDRFEKQLQEFCNIRFSSIENNETGFESHESGCEDDNIQQEDDDTSADNEVQKLDDDSYETGFESHESGCEDDNIQQEDDDMSADNEVQKLDDDSYEVIEMSCTGVRFPDPQTREDFLQYACELTMDPSTAHKDLLLSQDYREVKVAPLDTRSLSVCHPERFLHRRQLLCREGLQAENCYYEIEVIGEHVEVGLAYKSISRKSRVNPSAFGANAVSWSLDCFSTHYSVSHNGESVELTSDPGHGRIGVYLNFIEGTVTFYEVSDTMKYLYKMRGGFTEPLYPGFWVGKNCCIRICDLTRSYGPPC